MARAFATLIFVVLCCAAVCADTHYVSKSGSNTYPYDTWAKAADTVARAVEAAAEWDTIVIAVGHYVTGNVLMKRGQVLMGSGADSTFLDTLPSDQSTVIVADDSCTFAKFSMRGDYVSSALAAGDFRNFFTVGIGILFGEDQAVWARSVRFEYLQIPIKIWRTNSVETGRVSHIDSCAFDIFLEAVSGFLATCEVRGCRFRWDRTASTAAIFNDGGSLVVENCVFFGDDTSTLGTAGAIVTIFNDPIIVRNCLIYSGMPAHATRLNHDGSVTPVTTGIVENCTFVRCFGHVPLTRPGFVVRNNLSMWSEGTPFGGNDLAEVSYNITWNNTPWDSGVVRAGDTIPNDYPGHSNNRNADPMFTDTLVFLPQSFSPAIDAGDPSLLDPDGSRSDIGYTGGPGGFTYAYQDLPPAVPHGITATPSDSQIALLWRGNHEADLNQYSLYRDTLPIATSEPALLLTTLADSTYTDTAITSGQTYYYRLTATDNQANTSALSEEVSVIAAGIGDEPVEPWQFELHQNYPNPFNVATRVEYVLDQAAEVELVVYDILGRRVETLEAGLKAAGRHRVSWNAGERASGVYFIVLEASGNRQVRKALLLK